MAGKPDPKVKTTAKKPTAQDNKKKILNKARRYS